MWKASTLALMLSAGMAGAACPVLDSRDWSAELVAAGTGYTLILRGTVDLPTPGYRIAWTPGPMDRALPPGWSIGLTAAPPEGLAAQVVTPTRIEARFETAEPRLRILYVGCEGRLLTELTDIAAPAR